MQLEVHDQFKADIYRDVVRIPEEHRKWPDGRPIREGKIVRLHMADRSAVVWLRGMENETKPWIRMDDKTRNDLGVDRKQNYEFKIEKVWPYGRLKWVLDSSDPALRITAWIALISLGLGVLSFALALWTLRL